MTKMKYENTGEMPYNRERGKDLELIVTPPTASRHGRPRGGGGRRSASYRRRQLVMLIVDDSASMKGSKAAAATEATREMIYRCKSKCNGDSVFDVSVLWFGDHIFSDEKLLLKSVLEIDEDEIEFHGDSGGTRIKMASEYMAHLILEYDTNNLRHNEEKERVPAPLIIFMSDGKNGDGNPIPIANKLTTTALSIGVPPMLCTVGIEFDGGEPDVDLLTEMASKTEEGDSLYFDIENAAELVEKLATAGSSAAMTPEEILAAVMRAPYGRKYLPGPGE